LHHCRAICEAIVRFLLSIVRHEPRERNDERLGVRPENNLLGGEMQRAIEAREHRYGFFYCLGCGISISCDPFEASSRGNQSDLFPQCARLRGYLDISEIVPPITIVEAIITDAQRKIAPFRDFDETLNYRAGSSGKAHAREGHCCAIL
jgi:hypothetical protein